MRTDRPLTVNVAEAGNLLGVSRSTAYELVRSGELESVQLRRRVVVPVAAIADRLRITVPDVWLAIGSTAEAAPPEPEDRAVSGLVVGDVRRERHAELTKRAQRRNQSLHGIRQTELDRSPVPETRHGVEDRPAARP